MDFHGFPDLTRAFKYLFITILCLIPFAAWKVIDLGIWLWNHLNISFQ